MRIIIFLIIVALVAEPVSGQVTVNKDVKKTIPDQSLSKKQIQAEMVSAINEINTQIAKAKAIKKLY
jgi:hypothetical protein